MKVTLNKESTGKRIADELRKWAEGDTLRAGMSLRTARDQALAIADRIDAAHEDAMAEHGWVRKNKEHVISHATVEGTPHIDWSRMADELDEFVKIVRGMAGDAE